MEQGACTDRAIASYTCTLTNNDYEIENVVRGIIITLNTYQ